VSQSNWTDGNIKTAIDYTKYYANKYDKYKAEHVRNGIPYHKRPCTEKQQKYIDAICFELFNRVSRHKYTMYEANKFITKYERLFKQHVRARKAGRVFDTIAVDYNKGPHYGVDAQTTDALLAANLMSAAWDREVLHTDPTLVRQATNFAVQAQETLNTLQALAEDPPVPWDPDDLNVQATVLRAYAEWNKQNETGYTFGDASPDSIPSVEPLDSKDISTWFDELYKE
jgi:phage tail protein X